MPKLFEGKPHEQLQNLLFLPVMIFYAIRHIYGGMFKDIYLFIKEKI